MAVQFEEEQQFKRPTALRQSRHGAVTNLILKLGLAKTPGQANIVMLIIAVIALGLAVYLMLPDSVPPTPIENLNFTP